MAPTSDTRRTDLSVSPRNMRPIVWIAVSAPLILSACVSSQPGMKTSAATPAAGTAVDAYGYAPVRISAFADGSRIALPSGKPNAAKLAAAPAAKPASETASDVKTSPKSARPMTEIAALQADVAERKATTVTAPGFAAPSAAVESKSARLVSQTRPQRSALATAASALDPAAAVPAAVAAVSDTADAVKDAAVGTADVAMDAASAVKVAAVVTTAKAYRAVTERIGDTFKGSDTITGDAAIDRMIERSAAENGIPSELAYAVVRVESHYNPRAKGSGVYGLSQIQPSTARSLGFPGQTADLYDPETNLRYGMKYLAGAWQKSGHDVCGAAMKYKGGHRTTRMSKSAAAYCANVKRHMAAIERRRVPANRETIVAAAERSKQIAVAAKAMPSGLPLVAAANSQVGRSVAATPEPRAADMGVALTLTADKGANRGGRVIRSAVAVPASAAPLGLAE